MKWVVFNDDGIAALDESKEEVIWKVMKGTVGEAWDYFREKRNLKLVRITDALAEILQRDEGKYFMYDLEDHGILCTWKEAEVLEDSRRKFVQTNFKRRAAE